MLSPETIRRRVLERLQEQRTLVASLLELREQLQGSLFTRYGECGKAGCACGTGAKHGPYYVLSSRTGGRAAFAYLEIGKLDLARERVKRYREFKKGLQRLQRINLDLVTMLKRYQAAAVKREGRRFGLATSA